MVPAVSVIVFDSSPTVDVITGWSLVAWTVTMTCLIDDTALPVALLSMARLTMIHTLCFAS